MLNVHNYRSFIFIITTVYLLTSIYSSFLLDGYLGYFQVLSLQIMLLWIFFWCLSAHLRDFLGCFIGLNTVAENRIYSIYNKHKGSITKYKTDCKLNFLLQLSYKNEWRLLLYTSMKWLSKYNSSWKKTRRRRIYIVFI